MEKTPSTEKKPIFYVKRLWNLIVNGSMPEILLGLLSFFGVTIWASLTNHYTSKFYSGYLSKFGITSNLSIEKITIHSKLMLFIVLLLELFLASYLIFVIKRSLSVRCNNNKAKTFFKLLISSFITIYLFWLSLFLYLLCIENSFLITDILKILLTEKTLWIAAFLSSFGTTFILFPYNSSNNNVDKHNQRSKKTNPRFVLLITLMALIFTLCAFEGCCYIFGKSFAELELTYPSFSQSGTTFIVIASVSNDKYLVIKEDEINSGKSPTYKIMNIEGLCLSDTLNPLFNN